MKCWEWKSQNMEGNLEFFNGESSLIPRKRRYKPEKTLLKLHLLWRFQKRYCCYELQRRFLKKRALNSHSLVAFFQKCHNIPLIAMNLKTSLKKRCLSQDFL